MQCPLLAVGSSLMQSVGLDKKCEPKVVVNDFPKPTSAEFSRSLGVQSHPEDSIEQLKVKEGISSVGGLSPLVPTRLTQRFRNVVDDVECSQYVVERFLSSIDHANDEAVDDVQIVGSSSFVDRCKDLSRSNDAAYNKLNNFNLVEAQSTSRFPKNQKAGASPEVEILSSGNASRDLSPAQVPKADGASFIFSSGSSGGHQPRRMVLPGRFNSDPYVAQGNKFPVTVKERRHHLAMVQIGNHESWCKYEAIRYDRAYCSYRNLATLKSREHVDNFFILCVCRYLFKQAHPLVSKKHCFFSYIGETILRGSDVDIVGNAFTGANNAFPMWRSNLLFFPIGQENHWFTFVVCLKERAFAFLDSLYGAKDHFHLGIRDKLIANFITIWDQFVTPLLRKRIDFENFDIVYPTLPQQNNWDDCGVFTVMHLKHWTPRTPIGNMFGASDVDNITIRLVNELYFSGFNSVDKTFVTHFFDDVKA
ncbi:hypothetical protein CFC21_102952 [Triticum aestivum]|uniref:Ubiquitin-like protease family profile domain-containing protein n=2 Tax=Triticum aestivum TaxID=4565 RepID=A0A9R1N5R5_WHEAT|nr:hypothetical protein CFC21_102951 [Triticum aestivum]KAF7101702.1 hypothetical protein CFC21_102952 [Triticum aestivum]